VKKVPTKAAKSVFQKTDVPCLYRSSSTKVYFALLKHEGKQKRVSLKTTDKAEAKRNLAEERRKLGKVDSSQGKITLDALCTKYLATIGHFADKTVVRKKYIVRRLLDEFPKGRDCQVSKIRQSDLEAWLAGCKLGAPSHILFVQLLKELFTMAVNDKSLVESPAEKIRSKKAAKPVRITPSFEEFLSIVANVRAQKLNADCEESADFLAFLGLVGVGQAEASSIEKQHVNLRNKKLTFLRRKTDKAYDVKIFPQAEELVTKLVSKPGMRPHTKLFSIVDAKKALAGSCRRLGLPAYSQRALRRMFITRCIELGIDVKVIAEWQGHSDGGKLILGTYSHVRNNHAEEMAKKLTLPSPVSSKPQPEPQGTSALEQQQETAA
jgi:integrase